MKNSYFFKNNPLEFRYLSLDMLFTVISWFLYCIMQWGALRLWAEIIPTEPDPDNAGAGMELLDVPASLVIY